MTDVFRSRVATDVVLQDQRDPAAFKSGVAEGLQELGGTLKRGADADAQVDERIAELEYQRTAAAEVTERSKLLQAAIAARAIAAEEARNNPKTPGAVGHAAAQLAEYDKAVAEVTKGVTTRAAQESLDRQIAAYRDKLEVEEGVWEVRYGVRRQAEAVEETTGQFVNQARKTGMAGIAPIWEAQVAYQDGLRETMGADQFATLDKAQTAAILGAGIDGSIDQGDFAAAEQALASEHAERLLTPKQYDALQGRLDYARKSAAAAERARQAEEQQQARQANATRQAELETGAGKPDDWLALATAQEAAGDPDGAVRSRAKGVEMQAAAVYRDYTLPQMDTRIRELEAVAEKTPLQASELNGLRDLRSQSAARLGRSGGALEQYAFATGKPIAPINLNDPASLRARAAQAKAAAAQYERVDVQPLLESELAGLRDLADGSPAQREQAVRAIAAFGDARVMLGAAGQITDKEDGAFRIALTQAGRPRVMKAMLAGRATLSANPKLWDEKRGNAMFNAYASRLLRDAPADYVEDLRDATKAFFADRARQGGLTAYDDGYYAQAVENVLGSVVEWNAPSGRKGRMVVPPGRDAAALLRGFEQASGPAIVAAQSAPPRWPDGSKVDREQLRELLPSWAGGTRYAFRNRDGGLIRDATGAPYTVDLGKLGGR